jgi:hypothetical protein
MKPKYFHLAVFPFSTTCLAVRPMRAELQLASVPTPDLRHRTIRLGVAWVIFRLVSSRSSAGRTGRMGATAT